MGTFLRFSLKEKIIRVPHPLFIVFQVLSLHEVEILRKTSRTQFYLFQKIKI